jgi:hypothetical protein
MKKRPVSGGPLDALSASDQRALQDGLDYLNLAEIKSFCRQHSIPYKIAIEAEDGSRR